MSQIWNRQSSGTSNAFVFTIGFVAGCSVAATLSYVFLQCTSSNHTENCAKKASLPSKLPLEIREEQLSRHLLYFGADGMERLRQAKICVVGVGGVGSHVAHMLARSGIFYLRLIDFDQVSLSSLNRHACATLADVGQSKVDCLAEFLRRICPDPQYLQIDPVAEMYTAESGERLMRLPSDDRPWDMVIDCIDDVKTKAALLAYCLEKRIRVLSCMGAGGKADPTRLHLSDLRSAAKDPLATKIRQYLKAFIQKQNVGSVDDASYLDDMEQLTVLYSSEKTVVKLADFTDEQKQAGVHQYGAVDGMRIRIVPVLGTMPAIMGQALASYCITTVAGAQRIQPVTSERIGRNSRNKMYQMLRTREQNITARVRLQMEAAANGTVVVEPTSSIHGIGELVTIRNEDESIQPSQIWIGELQIDQGDDVEYLLEVWRNRCAITGARLGTVLHLVRWDRSQPSTCDNLVVISANVLKVFESDPDRYKQSMNLTIRKSIEERLAFSRADR